MNKIIDKKKKNRDLVIEYKNKLQDELEAQCEKEYGHKFWNWQTKNIQLVAGWLSYEYRICQYCNKTEYRNEQKELW